MNVTMKNENEHLKQNYQKLDALPEKSKCSIKWLETGKHDYDQELQEKVDGLQKEIAEVNEEKVARENKLSD